MPFSWLFGAAVQTRRYLYEKNVFKSQNLEVPVVSIGNLTVGGTGKTPLVAFVARILAEHGHRVCVLTRGYKRENPNVRILVSDGKRILVEAKQSGDEPFELANKLLNVAAIVADKNRAAAGFWARENLGSTAFVLDDGFQHWRVKRDLDIVTIDATNPIGNGKLLPIGILREPLSSLKRADCIILTRANLTDKIPNSKFQIPNSKFQIPNFNLNCPIVLSRTEIAGLTELKNFLAKKQSEKPQAKNEEQRTKNVFAFCALGNPENFFESLRRENFEIRAVKSFQDHHAYTQRDVEKIEKEARTAGGEVLLTTAKDAVKLQNLNFSLPCFVVEIEVIFDDDKPLRALLGTF